jgi:hypothetical protein
MLLKSGCVRVQGSSQAALSVEDEKLLNQIMASEQDFIDSPAF